MSIHFICVGVQSITDVNIGLPPENNLPLICDVGMKPGLCKDVGPSVCLISSF